MGQYELFMSIDLQNNLVSSLVLLPDGVLPVSERPLDATGTLLYGSSFDATTKILLCGKDDGSLSSQCEIQSLTFWFTSMDSLSSCGFYIYGIYRIL